MTTRTYVKIPDMPSRYSIGSISTAAGEPARASESCVRKVSNIGDV